VALGRRGTERRGKELLEENTRRGEEGIAVMSMYCTWLRVYWLNFASLIASARASVRNCGGEKSGIP